MNRLKTSIFCAGIIALLASGASAQTSGTVTVTGTNPEAFSLTSNSDGALASTTALATLTPSTGNTMTTGTATVRLRSNKAYKVTAQATSLSFTGAGSADGGSTIGLTDIGFGVTSTTLTGANVVNTGSRTDAIASGFDAATWPTASNGLTPSFSKTLADISSATQVLSGSRISKLGNISTDNNFIDVTFGVATLPQFFTPNNGFSSTVTLTIASQ